MAYGLPNDCQVLTRWEEGGPLKLSHDEDFAIDFEEAIEVVRQDMEMGAYESTIRRI